jgi:hypothetical protein
MLKHDGRFGGFAIVVLVLLSAMLAASSASASSRTADKLRCKVASHGVHADDISGLEAVWKFKIVVSACYNGRRVVRPSVTCSVWHTDPVTIINNGCSTQDSVYAWRGNPYGGYYAQAQATFQNCIIKFACLTNVTVTLKIWMSGNGTWVHATTK